MDLVPSLSVFVYASLGGLLPALLWLWFFLKEDSQRPEPKWLIMAGFMAGMVAVLLALPAEMLAKCVASGTWPAPSSEQGLLTFCSGLPDDPIFLWAAIEEILKYGLVLAVVLWRRAVDEPIDAMIYLITVALGFAAFETALFLMHPFGNGDITQGILTGNLRFMGAALLHTLASAVVGFMIAIAFYRSYWVQALSLCTGLILATVLHALFNHHIIVSSGERTSLVFFTVWIGIVAIFLMFEKAKRVTFFTRPHL